MTRKSNTENHIKYFDDQFDDEEVLYVFKKHPVVMRKGLIFGMLALLLGTVPALIKPEMSYFWGGLAGGVVLGLLIYMPYWISWNFSVFIMTTQRFIQITQKGFFHKGFSDVPLPHIQSINYEVNGLEETLLGFGTIIMQTYLGEIKIHDVHHPGKIQKKMVHLLRDLGVDTQLKPNLNKEKMINER